MLADNAIVVVADGSSARIFKNTGHGSISLELLETVNPHSLTHEAGMPGHSQTEQSPKDRHESSFIGQLMHKLNALALAHALPSEVVIVADPHSLGHMRPLYHPELQRRITREVHKTMVKASQHDLAVSLARP